MTQKLKAILGEGQSEVLMVTPYFVPGQAGMRLFRKLRGRNLTIKIITNSFLSSDSPLAQIGYMGYRMDLLRMGVELYEIKPTLVQLQHDQEQRQFAGDLRRLCFSLVQGGGSLISVGPPLFRSAAPPPVRRVVPGILARQDLRPGSPNGVCGLLQL